MPPAEDDDLGPGERSLGVLLQHVHLATQSELPGLVRDAAAVLGLQDAVIYLADLQQKVLVPFRPGTADVERAMEPLGVDSTVAGRAFQSVEVLAQSTRASADGSLRAWLPLLDGTDRLGVLGVDVAPDRVDHLGRDHIFGIRLRRLASLVAEVIVSKSPYGDALHMMRRTGQVGLAAELQWSLLPPLTFASHDVTVAGALEPAYDVAGDTLDYAVDAGLARAGVFDGMGHGLRSSQLAAVSIAAFRAARRSRLGLLDTAAAIHDALDLSFDGAMYTTGVLLELDTATGALSWINAGHPPPLLLRDGRLVKTLTAEAAPPFGLAFPSAHPRPEFAVGHEQLEPDDRVLLYTDGVTEARSPGGDFFGEQRLADLLARNFAARLPAPETLRRVVRALMEHQQGQLSDDATLLLLEWRSDQADLLP